MIADVAMLSLLLMFGLVAAFVDQPGVVRLKKISRVGELGVDKDSVISLFVHDGPCERSDCQEIIANYSQFVQVAWVESRKTGTRLDSSSSTVAILGSLTTSRPFTSTSVASITKKTCPSSCSTSRPTPSSILSSTASTVVLL